MQYLKEEIRNRIISAALNEFMKRGYQDSSMRVIAKNAGVAIGNVYRYFKNKDELFNFIMDPVYTRFTSLVFNLYRAQDQVLEMRLIAKDITDKIMEIYGNHGIELLILMDKSKGSKYENIKDDLVRLVNDRLSNELIPRLEKNGILIKDNFIIYVLAATFVEGIFMIFRQYEEQAKIKDLISQLLILYFEDFYGRFK